MINSYLYGLFGTDGSARTDTYGHLSYIVLELSEQDKDIIFLIHELFPSTTKVKERERDTNFKKNYKSVSLYFNDKEVLKWFADNGFPIKNKTEDISVPRGNYNKYDFWRGVLDGDGSVIFRNEKPMINLTTKSEFLKEGFVNFVFEEIGVKLNPHRNKRDNIYNIGITSKNAQKLVQKIWYDDCLLSIKRKKDSADKVKKWINIPSSYKRWTSEEEQFLLSHSLEEYRQKYPNRSLEAIKSRLKKLK